MIGLLLALPISFLPAPWRERWRQRLPLVAGTGVTGTIQLIGFLLLWMAGLYQYATGTWPMFQGAAHAATGSTNASGAVVWFLYLLSPMSIVCLIGAAEGAVRLGAFWTDEACGSLVLFSLERGIRWWKTPRARKGPPPRDELTRLENGAIRIASADPFERWHELMTVEVDGAFYRVANYHKDAGSPREHVYELEPVPEGWTMRGLDKYAPSRPPVEKTRA